MAKLLKYRVTHPNGSYDKGKGEIVKPKVGDIVELNPESIPSGLVSKVALVSDGEAGAASELMKVLEQREKSLAEREAELVEREKSLAEREASEAEKGKGKK